MYVLTILRLFKLANTCIYIYIRHLKGIFFLQFFCLKITVEQQKISELLK